MRTRDKVTIFPIPCDRYLQQNSEFKIQNGLRQAALTEVKQGLEVALRLSLRVSLSLKSAVNKKSEFRIGEFTNS
jgi:hypothetical protein